MRRITVNHWNSASESFHVLSAFIPITPLTGRVSTQYHSHLIDGPDLFPGRMAQHLLLQILRLL